MKIVIDTNVLISGLINPGGTPAQIINLLINGKITLLYDNRILAEYVEVLRRKKFGFGEPVTSPLIEYIKKEGDYIAAEPISGKKFQDKDDKMFYEVAKTGKARCIVTGNKDHYPDEAIIRSPKEFIELYISENDEHQTEAT